MVGRDKGSDQELDVVATHMYRVFLRTASMALYLAKGTARLSGSVAKTDATVGGSSLGDNVVDGPGVGGSISSSPEPTFA